MMLMAKSKGRPRYPSDEKTKYVGIPTDYHAILDKLADAEERSVAYYARRAVREWLERNGHLPKPKSEK